MLSRMSYIVPKCTGVLNNVFPGNRTCLYKNAIVYNGRVYVHEIPQTTFVHNRWTHTYTPSHISKLPLNKVVVNSSLTAILHYGLHSNMGHMLLDNYYSAWHSFAALQGTHEALHSDIQMITFSNDKWPSDTINRISGVPYKVLSQMVSATRFPNLIIGNGGKGLCILDDNGIVLGDTLGTDPVKLFSKRIYKRFNVPRVHPAGVNRIVHIISKRPLNVLIDQRHTKMSWEQLTFKEQLQLLSQTKVLVVGVGTARTNTFLLPPGSVEVQTFNAVPERVNNMQRFDDHIATFVNHVRVVCPLQYTSSEARMKRVNLTNLVSIALNSDTTKHHWLLENKKCYKRTSNPYQRSGWSPRPMACSNTCPPGKPFSVHVRNSNDR
jgi:hypothetical protein